MSADPGLVVDVARLITPDRVLEPGRLLIRGGAVAAAGRVSEIAAPTGVERVEATQLIAVPGFIDSHIHGASGSDVMDATPEALQTISRALARHGATAFLPTTVSAPAEKLGPVLEKLGSRVRDAYWGARPVGLHLEGPFINPAKRGTHKARNLVEPSTGLLHDWVEASGRTIRLITLAPELKGSNAVIDAARKEGLTVGMGHSDASYEESRNAANSGVHYAVHTFNAMRAFSHRDPGILGEVLTDDRIFAELIADGIHVDPAAVRLLARAKSRERVVLVTDATSATGMPDGRYTLGSDTVIVTRGVCRDEEGHLAGSTLTQDQALRNFAEWTGWSVVDAVRALTVNPAKALRLESIGSLEPGHDADFTLLDDQLRVVRTYVGGRLVFDRLGSANG